MIRNFLLMLLFLFSVASFAQQGSASPYSYFGVGDVRFKGTHEMSAMGGVSILPDSIHINLKNPASYAGIKLTTFTVGSSFSSTKIKSETANEKAQRISLDYLAIALPLKKFGVAFGLLPYSTTGYKIKNQYTTGAVVDSLNRYSSSGGLNMVFAGLGYQFSPSFSIGANIAYDFGKIETQGIKYLTGVQYGSQETNTSELSGFNLDIGVMYNRKITNKLDFYSGITYSPESKINSNNEKNIFTVVYQGDLEPLPNDYLETKSSKSTIKLPSKLSVGMGFGESKKWLLGTEVTFKESSTFSNRVNDVANTTYENGIKFSLGGFYIPNYSSFSSYFQKVTYRAGFRYENTGLVINSISINDYAVTGGLGLPIGGAFSNLNLGFELGRRGTTTANLIKESYGNILISLSLNDKWFTARKYD